MVIPKKIEIKEKKERIQKIIQCYRFLIENCNDEVIKKKLEELSKQHTVSEIDEASYAVELAAEKRKQELEDKLRK